MPKKKRYRTRDKVHTIDTRIETTCLCGQKVSAGQDEHGTPCITHGVPTCELFDRIDSPIEYLAYLNKARSPN